MHNVVGGGEDGGRYLHAQKGAGPSQEKLQNRYILFRAKQKIWILPIGEKMISEL